MKISQQDGTLSAGKLQQLGATNADLFQEEMHAAMAADLKAIEVDFSETSFVDSHGLGALLLIHKTACNRHGDVPLRLLNPQPPVQQILELTRMHRIFEIVKRPVLTVEMTDMNRR